MTQQRLGRALVFLAGSLVGGLALAFVIVFARPELLRAPQAGSANPRSAAMATPPPADATQPPRVLAVASYADAVARAAPAVANIYSERLVKERLPPATLGELFGGGMPRYRQRIEQTLGSGVVGMSTLGTSKCYRLNYNKAIGPVLISAAEAASPTNNVVNFHR